MAKVSLRAYNREIEAMIDRGHLEEAIAHCQHILKSFPKHLETYRLLGKAYLESRRHNEAVDIFSRVLVAEPGDFVSQVGMSIIRDEQNKLDDAIWHMERAFEAQPSNAAIQGELQRLYGRRDGVQPPRVRMTRGALANMYMQGDLFPQAISEARSILAEDQGRSEMQTLLAKAYYRSGQKNDAADAASVVLKRYPYCLDANRVLADILGSDRPESAQTYRKRVVELDPYAAYVDASLFHSNDVNEAAVTIEQLDWNGQPAGSSGWNPAQAIGLESGEQSDWMRTSLPEEAAAPPSTPPFASTTGALPQPPTDSKEKTQDDNIPGFLREAGWGESTGEIDESKSSMFDDEPASSEEQIAQGDLPDWVKAMAPAQEETSSQEEEEMPDWINKIGTGELKVPSLNENMDDQLDRLGSLGGEEESESNLVNESDEQPNWLSQLGAEEPSNDNQTPSMDFISESEEETIVFSSPPAADSGDPGTSQDELDASLAWLEGLAAKQGATEGLLVNPEDRMEDEPEWIKQAKEQSERPTPEPEPVSTPAPSEDTENLGTSQDDVDASLAWLEGLAAKQGATEGLLVKPEDRKEEEPEWVKQAKSQSTAQQPPAETPPVQDTKDKGDLGKSDAERDDSFAWLENLAAKQGATEGLLTKPDERREEEPEWVKQVKQDQKTSDQPQQSEDEIKEPAPPEEEPEWMQHARSVGEQFYDDTLGFSEEGEQEPEAAQATGQSENVSSWMSGFDEEQKSETPETEDETTSWLSSLDEPEKEKPVEELSGDDVPDWMKSSDDEAVPAAEPEIPEKETEPAPKEEEIPGWLNELEKDETPSVSGAEGLPSWMRDETGEVVAEPTKIEPTQSSDWTPVTDIKSEEVSPPKPKQTTTPPKQTPTKKPPQPIAETKKKSETPAYKEPVTRKGAGTLSMPVDPALGSARAELSRSNIPGALEGYSKLIKKGRFLEEVIYDLREALYRYPVEVSIWQTLGDAYMRANQLQDALDAYTKAEELLR